MAAQRRGQGVNLEVGPELLDPGRIRMLASSVAEAIAAGEVVERPASAVKELVENSLDAGASRVSVELEDGGRQLLRVVDDGEGMSAGELVAAFQRHATSKLSAIEDLDRLRSFGFRGEALASIAAVSQVVAVSRRRGSDRAFEVSLGAGPMRGPIPTAAPPGTSVLARDLFFNVPARREFLRSPRVEASACARVVADAALGRPEVRFELRSGGRTLLRTPGAATLTTVVAAVLGADVAEALLKVDFEDAGLTVRGTLADPRVSRQTRQAMVLMVNGRRVQHRGLSAAVEGAYRGLLPRDRYPVVVLDVGCDPAQVDVNVHPTKREVRFRDEGRFFELVQRACWGALQGAGPRALELPPAGDRGSAVAGSPYREESLPSLGNTVEPLGAGELRLPTGELSDLSLAEAAGWRYLGQAHDRYLLAETGSGLAVLDQHAAHEKVLYQRLRALLSSSAEQNRPAQGLLAPVLVEVPRAALGAFGDAEPTLRRLGFELEPFGETTLRCSAVPPGLRLSELGALLSELLESWDARSQPEEMRLHRLAASMACHSAVRFGDPVERPQAEALLRDLALTEGGTTCPHGRPALLLISGPQLLSAFRRR